MTGEESAVIQGVVAFVLAFIGGYITVRLVGLFMRIVATIKAERARRARLDWFKRR